MVDPLSIAASVAGLISLAASVIQNGYKLFNTVRDCPKELLTILSEVSGLNGVLIALKPVVEELEDKSVYRQSKQIIGLVHEW